MPSHSCTGCHASALDAAHNGGGVASLNLNGEMLQQVSGMPLHLFFIITNFLHMHSLQESLVQPHDSFMT